jgi:hypothetical protein
VIDTGAVRIDGRGAGKYADAIGYAVILSAVGVDELSGTVARLVAKYLLGQPRSSQFAKCS